MSSVFSSQDQFCPFWDHFCGFAYIIRLGDHFCLGITFAVVQALHTQGEGGEYLAKLGVMTLPWVYFEHLKS